MPLTGVVNIVNGKPNDKPAYSSPIQANSVDDLLKDFDGIFTFSTAGTMFSKNGWRLDNQGPTQTHANLQIQKNGENGTSTVAAVLVPKMLEINGSLYGPNGAKNHANAKALATAITYALRQSAKSHKKKNQSDLITVYVITGGY